jgi:lambda family phage tail tape measure protein
MATNQVNINLSLQDQSRSIKQRTDEVKGLNKELQKAQTLATGTRTGSAAVSASYSAAGQNIEYGRARGSMGSTGAAGRDFANQAQGLGGLVRLYATYAANVFAVSAAFSALSEAMNTSMMIRGLDQLGAASGLALGGIAKQFANASEGAISLREAMEATAKATSSGLSKKQFMELGTVAKGASQALGVNMSDAVSRLTRGITKLEPELLDELGIFTKVGKASEDYARSVGKSVDSLTDFEKRQAFANAVLAEGRQKFGEIASETNVYDKLLANLKNVAQEILSTINVVVAPIAKLFADSTALIGLAIGVIALKITKQALPALASWREGLTQAATDAAKSAQDINTSFGEAFVERAQQRAKIPQLQEQETAQKLAYAERAKQFLNEENQLKKNSALSKAIASGEILTTRQLGALQAEITKKQNDTNVATQKHVEGLRAVQSMQLQMRKTAQDIVEANDVVQEQANRKSRYLSEEWQREKLVQQERAKAARLTLVAGVGERVSKEGLVDGFKGFYSDTMASKDLGRVNKFRTITTGAFVAVGQAASILGRSLSGALIYLEIAIAVFGILSYAFSKNGKEADALKSSIDSLSESTKTAINVAEKFADTLTVESINAKANAFGNLADDINTATTNLLKADVRASGFDKFIDGFKTIWGGDLRTQFTNGLTESINAAIKTAPAGEIRDNLEKKLISSLGTLDIEKGLDLVPTDKVVEKAREISKILSESDKILKASQAVTQEVVITSKATSEAFLTFSNAVYGQSPLQTFLNTSVKGLFALKKAFEDTLGSAAEFEKVLAGTANLQFLPSSAATTVLEISSQFEIIRQEQKAAQVGLKATEDALQKVKSKFMYGTRTDEGLKLKVDETALLGSIDKYKQVINKTTTEIAGLGKQVAQALAESSTEALDKILREFKLKEKQIKINTQQQVLASIPVKTEESIKEATRLAIASIDVEMQLQKSQQTLVNSVDALKASIDVRNAQETLAGVSAGAYRTPGAREEAMATAEKDLESKLRIQRILETSSIKGITAEDRQNSAVQRLIQNKQSASLAETTAEEKRKLEKLKEANALADVFFANSKQALEYEIKIRQAKLEELKLTAGVVGNEVETKKAEEKYLKEIQPYQRALEMLPAAQQATQTINAQKFGVPAAIAASVTSKIGAVEAQRAEVAGTKATTETTGAERNSVLAQARQFTADITVQEELRAAASTNTFNIQKEGIAASREQLSYAQTVGALTQQEIAAKTRLLSIEEAEIERRQKLAEIDKQRFLDSLAYSDKLAEAGYVETDALKEQFALIQAKATFSSAAAEREYQARLKTADITASLASKQTQYETVFKNSFEGMADAIVEFAKTGKLSFKDLTNTMLTELLRIELRMQMSQIWSAIRPGFGNIFTSIFGSAQGSVYNDGGGLQKFGKGGMFTNSIVDSPTLFKFAKGTGVMGEAGPEAIMPLKRDSSGNLGVRSTNGGSNVEVVVINNTGEKAETRETTDSRGNRKVEVTIGDMTAGEISRAGSASQKSIRSTFGIQPQLIRR